MSKFWQKIEDCLSILQRLFPIVLDKVCPTTNEIRIDISLLESKSYRCKLNEAQLFSVNCMKEKAFN